MKLIILYSNSNIYLYNHASYAARYLIRHPYPSAYCYIFSQAGRVCVEKTLVKVTLCDWTRTWFLKDASAIFRELVFTIIWCLLHSKTLDLNASIFLGMMSIVCGSKKNFLDAQMIALCLLWLTISVNTCEMYCCNQWGYFQAIKGLKWHKAHEWLMCKIVIETWYCVCQHNTLC